MSAPHLEHKFLRLLAYKFVEKRAITVIQPLNKKKSIIMLRNNNM